MVSQDLRSVACPLSSLTHIWIFIKHKLKIVLWHHHFWRLRHAQKDMELERILVSSYVNLEETEVYPGWTCTQSLNLITMSAFPSSQFINPQALTSHFVRWAKYGHCSRPTVLTGFKSPALCLELCIFGQIIHLHSKDCCIDQMRDDVTKTKLIF